MGAMPTPVRLGGVARVREDPAHDGSSGQLGEQATGTA